MTTRANILKGKWWDRALTLVEGCTPVSPGCENCWSASMAHLRQKQDNPKIRERYEGLTGKDGRFCGTAVWMQNAIDLPKRVQRPTTFAVWNDLFHEGIPRAFVLDAYKMMEGMDARGHRFLILTKRPKRAIGVLQWVAEELKKEHRTNPASWPHVWVGTSVETQEETYRVAHLLQIPAAHHFVSLEPLLGPVTLKHIIYDQITVINAYTGEHGLPYPHAPGPSRLDWVITGAESQRGRRRAEVEWFRELRDECKKYHVPFFLKQMDDPAGRLVKMPLLDGVPHFATPRGIYRDFSGGVAP